MKQVSRAGMNVSMLSLDSALFRVFLHLHPSHHFVWLLLCLRRSIRSEILRHFYLKTERGRLVGKLNYQGETTARPGHQEQIAPSSESTRAER